MEQKQYEIAEKKDLLGHEDQDQCNCCSDCIWEKKVELSTGETYNPYRLWEIMDNLYGL